MNIFDFKHFDILKKEIGEINPGNYYHFFTQGRWSMHDLLLYLLFYSGNADVLITSFSISDEIIRTFINAADEGYINSLKLILNTSVKRNKTSLLLFANNVVKFIALAKSHMKLILIENENFKIIVNQSANSTINPSCESGVICTIPDIYDIYKNETDRLLANSVILQKNEFIG
jgi:hypothetical protein